MNQEAQEVAAYATAEHLRKEILSRPLKHANASVDTLRGHVQNHSALSSLDELVMTNTRLRGGLQTADAVEQANSLLRILNDNATLVFSWREKIVELLSKAIDAEEKAPASDGQDVVDPDKEYYAEALQDQGEGKV